MCFVVSFLQWSQLYIRNDNEYISQNVGIRYYDSMGNEFQHDVCKLGKNQ